MNYTDEHVWNTFANSVINGFCAKTVSGTPYLSDFTNHSSALADAMLIEHRKRFPFPTTPADETRLSCAPTQNQLPESQGAI
jgi:hypothetical protein